MKYGSGWYYFADGHRAWFYGLNGRDRANEVRKHGKIIRYIPD